MPIATSRIRSRARVVLLQSGDPLTLEIWRQMVEVSLTEFDRIYAQARLAADPGGRGRRECLQRRNCQGLWTISRRPDC